jgi:hypothetical protein
MSGIPLRSLLLLPLVVCNALSYGGSAVASRVYLRPFRPRCTVELQAPQLEPPPQKTLSSSAPALAEEDGESGFSYSQFARDRPFANNIMIATAKTAAADLLAQTVIAQTPLDAVDWQRSLLFMIFGAVYLGGFQYLYQVQIFKRLFDVDSFTSQPWADKLRDGPGLRALAAQTALDLTVLTLIYLPTFYVFKAGVFSGSLDPGAWVDTGLTNYAANFAKDELDLVRVWLPADLVCFSVPLYLRLPVRHVVSFVWTAYLSFTHGAH